MVSLPAGLSVGGTVLADDGTPLASVLVGLNDGDQLKDITFSDVDGEFAFLRVPAGGYQLGLYEPVERVVLPDGRPYVAAQPGDPAAGQVTYQVGRTPILTSAAPAAEARVAQPYAFDFTASQPEPVFAVASGQVPRGLALSATGRLQGAPSW